MHATYHFDSTSEITSDIIDSIKSVFNGKAVTITVEEDIIGDVPEWHKELVYARLEALKKNPEKALSEEQFWKEFNKIGK